GALPICARPEDRLGRVGVAVGRVAEEEHLVDAAVGGRLGRVEVVVVAVADVGACGGAPAEGQGDETEEERADHRGGCSRKRRRAAAPERPSVETYRGPSGPKARPSGWG